MMARRRRRISPPRSNAIASSPFTYTIQLLVLLLSTIMPVSSTPISYFPLNSQLPPVARVSVPFSFVFSPLTFSSDAGTDISYALGKGSPSWLSLNSTSRTISGTPDEASVPPGETLVGVDIVLEATDDTGSTTANATLVVTRNQGPFVRIPLEDQIPKFGVYSAPASLLLPPETRFSFEFDVNTFGVDVAGTGNVQSKAHVHNIKAHGHRSKNHSHHRRTHSHNSKGRDVEKEGDEPGPELNYYAVSGDNAPLPSWIKFDAGKKLAFSGITPPFASLIQPPQTFHFQLVASDVAGFSAISIGFSIAVGVHQLTAEEAVIKLNATRGTQLDYTDLPDILKIDGRPLTPDDLSFIGAYGLPGWLSFDKESWKISGTPDTEARPTNITIMVIDEFLDTLNVTLAIEFQTELFVSDLPSVDVTAGDKLMFDLKRFLSTPTDTEIVVQTQPGDSWISFDDSSMIIAGTVPKPLAAGFASEVRIALSATNRRTKDEETKFLNIHVNLPASSPEPSQPTPGQTSKARADSQNDLYWLLTIPVLVIAVAIILALFIVRKRRQRPNKLDFPDVSAPVPGSFVMNNNSTNASLHDMRKMLDMGPTTPTMYSRNYPPVPPRTPQARSDSSVEGVYPIPHAIAMPLGAVRLVHQDDTMAEARDSGSAEQKGRPPPMDTDEGSLLSDTSLGDEVHMDRVDLYKEPRNPGLNAYGNKSHLELPFLVEPFSIQPTPELAYTESTGKYRHFSDEVPPAVGYVDRRRSNHRQSTGFSLRVAQQRLSKAWKRRSSPRILDDMKHNSTISASTDVTTQTSILTSGFSEEATTASTNILAKPTVIHIPSRPGDVRRVSRRTDDSTTLSSGRIVTKSQRNHGLAHPVEDDLRRSGTIEEPNLDRESGMPWDRMARNSLGIAYKDVIWANREARPSFAGSKDAKVEMPYRENWESHDKNYRRMSPDRWPIPATTAHGVFRSQNEPRPLRVLKKPTKAEVPVTPSGKGKKRASLTRRISPESGSLSSLSQTPSTTHRHMRQIRERKALEEFRAMRSQTPPRKIKRAEPVPRRLPATPSRAPLTDRLNDSSAGGGLKGTFSKRSTRTSRSNKSTWTVEDEEDEQEDEDAWEDVRPPESTVGGWEVCASDGSFSVYI